MPSTNPHCGACSQISSWKNQSINSGQSKYHTIAVVKDTNYRAELSYDSDCSLTVQGSVRNLEYSSATNWKFATFTANATGNLTLKVSAGDSADQYSLFFMYPA